MRSVRPPAVAGRFYAADEQTLRDQLHSCYRHDVGPGSPPEPSTGAPSIRGLVTPHAGLAFSGPVAAHAYAALAASGRPSTVVIIGPNHTGIGASVALAERDSWQTPLGELSIDDDLRQALSTATEASIDALAHEREHAGEVQLPFLQYLYDDVSILPISLRRQDSETARRLGEALQATSEEGTVVVASSDFTHYEPHEVALERDQLALERIRERDPVGLFDTVRREQLSICGYGAIGTMLHAVDGEPTLLAHTTSAATGGSKDEVVSYAALSVE